MGQGPKSAGSVYCSHDLRWNPRSQYTGVGLAVDQAVFGQFGQCLLYLRETEIASA